MSHRIGFLASAGLALVGIAYAAVVGLGISQAGLRDPIVDPVLAVMEIITMIAALLIVVLMSSIYVYATEDRKTFAVIALSFGVLMAGLTSSVHFVALTAGRQIGFTALEWPSALYAVELLAWDIFLGLSLMFAAPVFGGSGLHSVARRVLATTGALCILGAIGPITGDMALQRIGILGYGVGLPVACLILALVFRRPAG